MASWDRQLESWVAGHRVGFLDPIFRGLTYAGTYGAIWLLLAVALALLRRRVQIFLWVLIADLAAELSTDLLKELVDRSRPNVHTLVARPHSPSFPSGHAATSFACATVIAALEPRLRWAAYTLAALIALSRVYVGVHYPLDILAGAAWGIATGLLVLKVMRTVTVRESSSKSEAPEQSRS